MGLERGCSRLTTRHHVHQWEVGTTSHHRRCRPPSTCSKQTGHHPVKRLWITQSTYLRTATVEVAVVVVPLHAVVQVAAMPWLPTSSTCMRWGARAATRSSSSSNIDSKGTLVTGEEVVHPVKEQHRLHLFHDHCSTFDLI